MTRNKQQVPDWVRHAVFYEVYPQTFYDTDGDGIGDLPGLIEKLDYIQSTGATALWLNPFYLSPMRDAGYDVADYCQVDPRYGTLADAEKLFAECRERRLRVIIDFVPGHTSIDHPWFKESAQQNAPRPYRNWFIWTDSAWNDGGDPWNRQMIHGYGNRDGNYLINFFWSQPALNFGFAQPEPDKPWQLPTDHPDILELRKEMRRILRFWLDLGVDGFRVDMADSLIRNDPDKSAIRGFWKEVRDDLEPDFPELFLIAEGHPSNVLDGTGFHAAFLHWAPGYWQLFRKGETRSQTGEVVQAEAFFAPEGKGDFRPYLNIWRDQYEKTKGGGIITTPIGNHDLPRVAVGQSDEMLEMIFAFQAAWPGIPFVYYGDEIGMRQQSSDNPIHEGHYPTRNGARTPMQWDNSQNCGFSNGPIEKLYLPVDPEPGNRTVQARKEEASGLWSRIHKIHEIRKTHPALAADAEIEILSEGGPGEPLAFSRRGGGSELFCLFAPAKKPVSFPRPSGTTCNVIAGRGLEVNTSGTGKISGDQGGWIWLEKTPHR